MGFIIFGCTSEITTSVSIVVVSEVSFTLLCCLAIVLFIPHDTRKNKKAPAHKQIVYFRKNLGKELNTAYFIARKILKGNEKKQKISRPVVRISIVSIVLSMVVMIVTLSIVTGFQEQVRNKIIGFGAHIQVMNNGGASMIESDPMLKDTALEKILWQTKGVKSVQTIAYKTAIFQSKKDSVFYQLSSGKDTFQIQQEIKGVLFKGVNTHFDWHFFQSCLLEGRIPHYCSSQLSNEILISKKIAQQMHFRLNDTVNAFFVQQKPIKRNFIVVGIFETGLENFDDDVALADIKVVQKYSAWGIEASLQVSDSLYYGGIVIEASAIGGNGNYKFDWGKGYEVASKMLLFPKKDTQIRVIVSDYFSNPYDNNEACTISDTAYLRFTIKTGNNRNAASVIQKKYLNDDGTHYSFEWQNKHLEAFIKNGKGSSSRYISGYEISVGAWKNLQEIDKSIKKNLYFWGLEHEKPIEIRPITQIYSSIFSWLGFLDLNFLIIITLMIVISVITMGATLLVLILEQTSTIGVLKSLGASNWLIRKVFIVQAASLILKGLLWGNLIGIGLCILQANFTLIPLDSAVYYLNAVPIDIHVVYLLLLNLGTLLVCLFVLLIPSYFITRISPAQSIKFK
jgi:lipoprotein-releasing system permease protein